MIIKPRVRGFICITAHPDGCEAQVNKQVEYVLKQGVFEKAPKRVLILGASTGYGLASRIVSAMGGKADTFGVFFERPGDETKPASPGWYNTVAFEKAAEAQGLKAYSMNGDAFSAEFKAQVVRELREKMGLTILFIAHDLSVVKYFSDRIGVMYFGNLVELAPTKELFEHPLHPYTKSLFSAIPLPDPIYEKQRKRIVYNPLAEHDYSTNPPSLREVAPGHFVFCNDEEEERYKQQLATNE